jgi:glutathione peroxidase
MARKNIYRLLATYLLIILQGVSFASSNIFELNATTIEGDGIPLKQFQGKVILVVNTASRCGFTPQYKSLEQLFNKYKEKGFVVLAFPSNDFRQELSSNEEIKDFCEVKGFGKQDLFKYLTEDLDGKSKGEIRWNFEKFLVSRDGKLFQRFRSSLDPNHKQITQAIESLL